MKKIALAAVLAAGLTGAQAGVVTFEDLYSPTLPAGYGGLDWTNFFGTLGRQSGFVGTGYYNGVVSGSFDAFNGAGLPASISATTAQGFDLTDMYFTAAFRDNLDIVANATFENGTHASVSFVVNVAGPRHEFFNWTGLSSVTFVSSAGTSLPGVPDSDYLHFVIDDVNTAPSATTAVPEPANLALMLAGAGLLAGAARRRRAS